MGVARSYSWAPAKIHYFKNALHLYAAELISCTGVSGLQTLKTRVLCI